MPNVNAYTSVTPGVGPDPGVSMGLGVPMEVHELRFQEGTYHVPITRYVSTSGPTAMPGWCVLFLCFLVKKNM